MMCDNLSSDVKPQGVFVVENVVEKFKSVLSVLDVRTLWTLQF